MESQETPEQYLKCHDLTRQLEAIGITDEQLEGMRFTGKNKGYPFDQWSFTYLGTMPLQALPLVKAYATLKWLVLDNPSSCRDTVDAWRLISETMVAPNIAIGEKARKAQSDRAKRPRGKITLDGKTLGQITGTLATQYPSETAKGLWPHLMSVLDSEDLQPEEITDDLGNLTYEYDFNEHRKRISFRRFQAVVSTARREKKSH